MGCFTPQDKGSVPLFVLNLVPFEVVSLFERLSEGLIGKRLVEPSVERLSPSAF